MGSSAPLQQSCTGCGVLPVHAQVKSSTAADRRTCRAGDALSVHGQPPGAKQLTLACFCFLWIIRYKAIHVGEPCLEEEYKTEKVGA